jgi:transposase
MQQDVLLPFDLLSSDAGVLLLRGVARRLHRNVLVIALANKLARIALTVLVQGRNYETRIEPVTA